MYTVSVKRITFSADQGVIGKARSAARMRGTTLNAPFREWLLKLVAGEERAEMYRELVKSLRHVRACRHISRDEMNER